MFVNHFPSENGFQSNVFLERDCPIVSNCPMERDSPIVQLVPVSNNLYGDDIRHGSAVPGIPGTSALLTYIVALSAIKEDYSSHKIQIRNYIGNQYVYIYIYGTNGYAQLTNINIYHISIY